MKLKERNGIPYPARMKRGSWIVAGPPGSGKSYLVDRIGGYPGEVAIDISEKKWWTVEPLTHRPREIHLALPFQGLDERLTVYDDRLKTMTQRPEPDLGRIRIPQKKKFILAPNWHARFVFDFILPPPRWLFDTRMKRLSSDDVRLVDMALTPEWVAWQVHVHWKIARHFQRQGLQVMLRPFNTARPYSFSVLEKILRKPAEDSARAPAPSLDWSKIRNVKLWIDRTAPAEW